LDFEALLMGLVGDGISVTIKKRIKSMGADREKLMANIKEDDKG
jgi:hypothetical protein